MEEQKLGSEWGTVLFGAVPGEKVEIYDCYEETQPTVYSVRGVAIRFPKGMLEFYDNGKWEFFPRGEEDEE